MMNYHIEKNADDDRHKNQLFKLKNTTMNENKHTKYSKYSYHDNNKKTKITNIRYLFHMIKLLFRKILK